MIAQTEMNRAVSIATRDRYESAGIQMVEWLTVDPCDECQENADASPISIDETFPSGDSEPPAHPNCMCALSVPEDQPTDNIEMAVTPDLSKISLTKLQLERVLARFALNEKD